jgi:hypothetical protein
MNIEMETAIELKEMIVMKQDKEEVVEAREEWSHQRPAGLDPRHRLFLSLP